MSETGGSSSYEPYRPDVPAPEVPPSPVVPYGPPDPVSGGLRFGGATGRDLRMGSFRPHPGNVEPITPGPRPVPSAYRLAVLNLGPAALFVIVILSVSPLALWILVPGSAAVASCVGVALLGARAVRRTRTRLPLLRWGEVATVTGVDVDSTAVSYTNTPLCTARGWEAKREMYTGPGYRSVVGYRLGEHEGRLALRGSPYAGGVVLADPRSPDRALCVSQLGFTIRPGDDGRYPGTLSTWTWVGVGLTSVVTVGLVALAGALVRAAF